MGRGEGKGKKGRGGFPIHIPGYAAARALLYLSEIFVLINQSVNLRWPK